MILELIPHMAKIIGISEKGDVYCGKYVTVNGKDEIYWTKVPSIFDS